jgi:hypothetical protein
MQRNVQFSMWVAIWIPLQQDAEFISFRRGPEEVADHRSPPFPQDNSPHPSYRHISVYSHPVCSKNYNLPSALSPSLSLPTEKNVSDEGWVHNIRFVIHSSAPTDIRSVRVSLSYSTNISSCVLNNCIYKAHILARRWSLHTSVRLR